MCSLVWSSAFVHCFHTFTSGARITCIGVLFQKYSSNLSMVRAWAHGRRPLHTRALHTDVSFDKMKLGEIYNTKQCKTTGNARVLRVSVSDSNSGQHSRSFSFTWVSSSEKVSIDSACHVLQEIENVPQNLKKYIFFVTVFRLPKWHLHFFHEVERVQGTWKVGA